MPDPEDDGAAGGIEGRAVPAVELDSTTGERMSYPLLKPTFEGRRRPEVLARLAGG